MHAYDVQVRNAFWQGDLPDDEQHREEYAFLLSKEYILRTESRYKFNEGLIRVPQL